MEEGFIKRTYEGLLGGDYGNLGFYSVDGTYMTADIKVEELLQRYKGKKVRITVEEIK